MRRGLLSSVAIAALLSSLAPLPACQGGAAVTVRRSSPRPAAARSSAPRLPASGPSADPASGLLKPPAGEFRAIEGTVHLEAAYAIAHGGASILSSNGASVLQLGDAALISDQGGNLIANNGGGIISDNGGGLISDRGGGLISDQGGGLIANNGGGLTSKTKWRLAAEGDPAPEFGTVVPAAGLALGVVDLATGQLLALGQDAAGRPAHAVVTNAAGGFRVYVPAALMGTVRVVGVPREGADPGLRSALLSSRLDARIQLDEDTLQVANDVRQIMGSNFFRAITTKEEQVQIITDMFTGLLSERAAADIAAGAKQLVAAYRAAGVPAMSQERQLAIANRLSDVVIAHARLEELRSLAKSRLTPIGFLTPATGSEEPGEPALAALGEAMAQIRLRVSAVMAAEQRAGRDPAAYFARKPYIQEAAARDKTSYAIRKPADFSDFLVRGVQANPALNSFESTIQLATVLSDKELDLDGSVADAFVRAQVGISLALSLQTYSGEAPILPAVLKALAEAAAEAP